MFHVKSDIFHGVLFWGIIDYVYKKLTQANGFFSKNLGRAF